MAELRFSGRVASGGFAAGPLAVLLNAAGGARGAGEPAAEAQALRQAIASALDQLLDLAARAESDGADILAFQIAMLEDETLAEAAFSAIEVGATADRAWRTALDDQILEYESTEDEHFRARSSDLRDMRDRVLGALSGAATDSRLPSGAILVGEDLTPSRFLATDWSGGGGIALTRGSASGHVATLARARGVPMIVGLAFDLGGVAHRTEALIDSESATLCLDPEPATREDFAARARAARRSRSAAGRVPDAARGHRRRDADRSLRKHRRSRRSRNPGSRLLRRDRSGAHRVPVQPRTARPGDAISRLSTARRMGGAASR